MTSKKKKKDAKDAPVKSKRTDKSELSADELDSVAGGFNPQPDPPRAEKWAPQTAISEKLVPAVLGAKLYQKI